MGFTYEFPDSIAFLYTLREFLEAEEHVDSATLLVGAICEFGSDGQFSHTRWNSYDAWFTIRVQVDKLPQFTNVVKNEILNAAGRIFPTEAGYELSEIRIAPFMLSPPEENLPLNTASLVSSAPFEHDGLRFRSKTEIKIYNVLKQRNVLFFPNPTAVLGGKNLKREPDFLICFNGKWGILEVMGDHFHTATNAFQDHDRARLFKDYLILMIEFYDARRCYDSPAEVVDDFLGRLQQFDLRG